MPFNVSDLVKSLFRRSVTTPASARTTLSLTALEDRTVPTPVVTIQALSNLTEGGGATAAFRLTRSDTTGSLSVGFTPTGTATPWSDFSPPFSVVFAPGSATADVTLTATNDATSEATETITLSVTDGANYDLADPSSATITILDNDAPVVSVAAVVDATEGGGAGIFRLTRLGDLSSSLAVNVSVGGTATSGTDYTALGTAVAFGVGSATADVIVTAGSDLIYDPDETVTLTVSSGTGYTVSGSSATMSIIDNADHVFTAGSYQGTIWYTIPWANVDFDAASQSLAVSNFALTLAGQTFSASDSQSAPTAQFEDGVFVGITFTIDTSGVANYPFTSLSMSAFIITATPPVGPPILVAAQVERAALVVDFKNAGGNPVAYEMTVKVETQTGNKAEVKFNVPANTTAAQLRDLTAAALKDKKGIEVEKAGDDRITFYGAKDDQLTRVRFDGVNLMQITAIKGKPVKAGTITPKLNLKGNDQ